jgi:hypothetical protein
MAVTVNAPKTPVTKGSNGIACATVPNVCKMPGPPAPFVPAPLPNIGKSGDSPKDYTKKVKVEGQTVAIAGATFKSMGDVASKGTGGGLISANTHGPTKFISPGSMDTKFEGKAVQQLGDMMLNNCGGGGSPPNSATLCGTVQAPGSPAVPATGDELECGEIGEYGDQKKRTGGGKYHRDHIPSKAALKERARELNGGKALSDAQAAAIDNGALSVVIPASAHREVSPTYGGRNAGKIGSDSKGLQAAAKRDTAEMKKELDKHADADCVKKYEEAAEKIDKMTDADYDKFLNNILKTVK